MSKCDYCKKKGDKHVTVWLNKCVIWGYTRDPPFQTVLFPLLCRGCLAKFKKLDKVIFYDKDEFNKHMNGDIKNIYDATMSNIVNESEYLNNAYELYNNL